MERMRPPHHMAGMRSLAVLFALLLALAPVFAPTPADARAGGGTSFGSRGARTYLPPPATRTAPGYAAPLRTGPAYGSPAYGAPRYGGPSLMHGFMGGLIGAGIAGLLLGHGFFWGMRGLGGLFGLLIQILLLVLLVRWLMRMFAGGGAVAGGGMGTPSMTPSAMTYAPPPAATVPLAVEPEDYQQFEAALHRVQAAWSAADIATLQRLATPDMAATFAAQLQDLRARGLRNEVSDVRLLQGDLSEAWRENGADYATVAMRFSMIDVTRDAAGQVVDGAPGEHVQAAELWTFLRPPGGVWILAAIQQAG